MTLEQRRRRARRLNDPNKTVEKDDPDDEVDPDSLELDYGGVVEKADDEDEDREQLVKGLGGSGDGIDFAEVFKQDRSHPDLDLDYSGIFKSDEESRREKNAEAIGAAVAEELAARGLADDGDGDADPSADGGGSVEKAGETTADLLDDVRDDLRGMKRVEAFKNLARAYYSDGGSPDDRLPDMLEWYNQRHPEATVKVEGGSVTVEEPA